jgi:CheY-like chemotaxis protein
MGLVELKRPVVLIVEDEFLLRLDAVDMIAAAGYEVLEAGNADEAIVILEAHRDITVIFTDIQMPGSMDGLKLARAVRGRWPPIKIVATSGHVHVSETDLPEGGRFLPKPYSPKQVTGVLRELMSGRGKLRNDIRRDLVFDEGDAVAQLQLALFQPLQPQHIRRRRLMQRIDRGIEIAVLLLQPCELGFEFALIFVGHDAR